MVLGNSLAQNSRNTITWTCGIRLKVISQQLLEISVLYVSLKIIDMDLQPHIPGAKEL